MTKRKSIRLKARITELERLVARLRAENRVLKGRLRQVHVLKESKTFLFPAKMLRPAKETPWKTPNPPISK